MFTVGLTGGIGSGKSTVAGLFAEHGATVIDTDAIARGLTAPGGEALEAIRRVFGQGIVPTGGALDRDRLRRLVFADPAARHALEAILHPRIRREVERALAGSSGPYAVVVIPLLVETGGYGDLLDRVLVVDCPVALQVDRVRARSALTEDEVAAIVAAQATRDERLAAADDVIVNTVPLHALRPQVAALHRRYLALAGAPLP